MSNVDGRVGGAADLRLPPGPYPEKAYLQVGELRVPLLPVYVGVRDGAHGRVPTWVLWVHPNWPGDGDVVLKADGPRPSLLIDEMPEGASVELEMKVGGGEVVVRRYRA